MKPNQQQLEIIEDLLGGVTSYCETYEELYDHVLSALESVPNGDSFENAVYHIIEWDLGGKSGITKIEERYRKCALKETIKKYLKYFGQYLISPYIIIFIALTIAFYLILEGKMVNQAYMITVLCFGVNTLLMKVRNRFIVKARIDGSYGKSSVTTMIYPYIGMLPIWLYVVFSTSYFLLSFFNLISSSALIFIVPAIFFINLVSMLTYYRLCGEELKHQLQITFKLTNLSSQYRLPK